MRKTIAIAAVLVLSLLLAPSSASAAAGVTVTDKTGDGVWTGDTWQVDIFPGEEKSTTLTLYNSSASSLAVEVSIIPSSLDSGNLTFELDKVAFAMPGKSTVEVVLMARASGSVTPGIYTVELGIRSEIPLTPVVVPPSGGGDGDLYPYAGTDSCGARETFYIDWDGTVIRSFTAGCEGGPLVVTIEKGTVALDESGRYLHSLTIEEMTDPPAPPPGVSIIAMPYELGPAGATFDPPITFTWTYDADDLPKGVDEEDLVLAYYDAVAGEWIVLDCVVDTEANTITASVSHFTTFAIIGAVPPPPSAEPPVSPTPEPPAPEPPVPAPTPPAPAPTPAPIPTPTPEPVGPNWLLIGGIIAGVVIVGLLIFFLVRRARWPRRNRA